MTEHEAVVPDREADRAHGAAEELLERLDVTGTATVLEQLNRSEIDIQVSTARRYPRSITTFLRRLESLATRDQATAKSCYYVLPRDGKQVSGPSIRLAELAACCWTNIRRYASLVEVGEKMVTLRGACHDVETNNFASSEVQRRIVKSTGARYSEDMIVVTINAAAAIAMRNAVLSIIPRSYIAPIVEKCRAVVAGDQKTIAARTEDALRAIEEKYRVGRDRVLAALGVRGVADVGVDQFADLAGLMTRIDQFGAAPDEVFPQPQTLGGGADRLKNRLRGSVEQHVAKEPEHAV